MLGDVTGIGHLTGSIDDMKGSLAHTNELLRAVLAELQQLNGERMAAMAQQLQVMTEQLAKNAAQSTV